VNKRHVIINAENFKKNMALQGSVSHLAVRVFKYWDIVFPFGLKGLYSLFTVGENKSNLSFFSFKHHVVQACGGVGTLVPCSIVVSGQVLVLTALLARK
jgi:hypothetical protein